jgi:hypothetical protein
MNKKPLILCYAVSLPIMLPVLSEQSVPFFLFNFCALLAVAGNAEDFGQIMASSRSFRLQKEKFCLPQNLNNQI